jgi:hypothetical protein
MTVRHYTAVVLLPLAIAAGCNERAPAAPTQAPSPSAAQSATVEMTGVVRGDDGVPIVGATVRVNTLTGTWYSQVSATTNAQGAYTLPISGLSGLMPGPPGTQNAIAFAYVSADGCVVPPACGYEPDYRYVLSATPLVQDFRLHRISTITAGESTVLTVEPHVTICVNNVQDMHPWPTEFVCRTVRIVAPADGVMTVEANPVDAGTAAPGLEVETGGGDGPCCFERLANPTSLPVAKGTVVKASVEVPWGTSGNHATFPIGNPSERYDYGPYDVMERVDADRMLIIRGTVTAGLSATGIQGTLSGGIVLASHDMFRIHASCYGTEHGFEMVRR